MGKGIKVTDTKGFILFQGEAVYLDSNFIDSLIEGSYNMYITLDGENWLKVKEIDKKTGNFKVFGENGIVDVVPFLAVGIKEGDNNNE